MKILAGLQGVSVDGLRSALEQACESEALAEMHSRVASLQAQLEAATIARKPSVGRSGGGSSLQDEAMAKNVANLELRLGELEEIDEKQRAEAQQLYTQLGEQKTSKAREAQVQELGAENEDLAAENRRLEQQEQRQRQTAPMPIATPAPPRPKPPIPREQIPVLTSDLLVEGSGRIRPWKKQHA